MAGRNDNSFQYKVHVPTQLTQKAVLTYSKLCVIEFCHFSSTLSCMCFHDMAAIMVGAIRAVFLLLLSSVIAQEHHPITIVPGHGANTCPSTTLARTNLERYILTCLRDNIVPSLVFDSCNNISEGNPSGYYYIRNNITGNYALNYCDMNRTSCCGKTGGWMRVANIDMTDPNQQCPLGLEIWRHPYNTTFNLRLCDRTPRVPSTQHFSGNSTTFPVNGVRYSRVCGKIKAYQFSLVNAFSWYAIRGPNQTTIDVPYVDGISLTHGSPRQHIWSFAAGIQEATSLHATSRCPCAGASGVVPPFVGQDYFCDSGVRDQVTYGITYLQDPLWDGQGCGAYSSCCTFNSPPWFCKQLPQATTDDIELRMCGDHFVTDEATPLELVEIYIQ